MKPKLKLIPLLLLVLSYCVFSGYIIPKGNATLSSETAKETFTDPSTVLYTWGTYINSTVDLWFGSNFTVFPGYGNWFGINSQQSSGDVRYITDTVMKPSPVWNSSTMVNASTGAVFGFWFKPILTSGLRAIFDVVWNDTATGHKIYFTFSFNLSSNNIWQVSEWWFDGWSAHQFPSGYQPLVVGDNYWFEMSAFYAGSWIITALWNGSALGSYSGISFTMPASTSQIEFAYVENPAWPQIGQWFIGYLRWSVGTEFPPSELAAPTLSLSADLEDIEGGFVDQWVFTNWKYYIFTLGVLLPNDTSIVDLGIRFSLGVETVGTVSPEFIATNDSSNGWSWEYVSDLSNDAATRYGEPVLLGTGETTQTGALSWNVTFPIFFQKQCLDLWRSAIDVYAACNVTNTITTVLNVTWILIQPSMFNIYSRGGFSLNYNTTSTGAYLIDGGTPFSFYASNGTSVYNEIWYRDVQHVKLLPDISFLTGYETFELQYGIDYVLEGNSSWQKGWLVQINPYTVSYTGLFAGNVWINMTGNFKNRDSWLSSNYLYMFYHGSVGGSGDPGHWKVWVDLWFSDTNASSTGAARINAYEYPMHDNADLWLRWLANNWGVKDDVKKEAQMEVALLDSDGVTPVSAGKIKMIRIWSNLTVEDVNAGQQIIVTGFDSFDLTHSKELPLTGIPAPVFDETKMPSVGQSGILGAVFSLFSGIGQWLSENVLFGGLNLWGNFVNFLDTIAGMLGAPHFFTNLFSMIGQSIGYVGNGAGYVFTVIYDIFLLLGSLMAGFLYTIGQLIVSLVNTVTYFTNIMSGAIGGAGNLWDQLGITNWIIVACVFYPIYLIILWEEKGTDAVVSQLTLIFGILSWFFNFFYQLATLLINFVMGIVESIPVVE